MTYDPKIFIRDYGAPTRRILAYCGRFALVGAVVRMLRALVLVAENPVDGEEFVLLSGDAQSGSDVILLSGTEDGLLAITNAVRIRFFGPDVRFHRHLILKVDSGAMVLDGRPATLGNEILLQADAGAFAAMGIAVGTKRSLRMAPSAGNLALNGADIVINPGDIILLSGDQQSGIDKMMLSGDEQSGSDAEAVSYSA